MWLAALGFMLMRLVSGLSLTNHSDSRSFLVVHASKMDVLGEFAVSLVVLLQQKFEAMEQCYRSVLLRK